MPRDTPPGTWITAVVHQIQCGATAHCFAALDAEPRLDTPAELAKRINAKLHECRQAEPVVQDALIKETYDLIHAWREAFVEQELTAAAVHDCMNRVGRAAPPGGLPQGCETNPYESFVAEVNHGRGFLRVQLWIRGDS